MKEIALTHGKVATVDDGDYETVSIYKWRLVRMAHCEYAITAGTVGILMHRLLMPNVPRIDHRDSNGLNNCRDNLRPCTHQQNMRNSRKLAPSSSKFKGVSFESSRNKWRVFISVNDKSIYIGRYANEVDAALSYDAAARKYHGEFARVNFT